MQTSILQDNLARGLNIVGRAVEARPTLPVLGNVLLATEDSRLRLSATNLELSITTYIGAQVQQDGAITLPAKTFSELVNNLSNERVDLTMDPATQTVNVRCGTTNSNIKGIAASEFPMVPSDGEASLMIDARLLQDMINQTVFAAAKEDNRPILTGIFMRFDDNELTMASADGYRLAVRTTQLEQSTGDRLEIVVPARTLSEVGRIISEEDEAVGITLPDDRDVIMFHLKNTDVTSQLLDGRFPDFAAIIPNTYSTSMVVYTDDLLRACKRAEIFARDSANSARIYIKPPDNPDEPGEVVVVGKSAERGDNEGMVDASVEGEPLEAAFNIRYLIDALNVIHDERVVLQSNGAAHPGVVRPDGREDFIAVIMPMSMNR